MTIYVFIGLLVFLFVLCLIKNLPAYDYFTKGAKDAIDICVGSFPYLVAIFVLVELFRASGLSKLFSEAFAPVVGFFGIPKELTELLIIKPFSGSGSMALLADCISTYGADSYIARCASVLMSTSETLFYITAVYFGTVGAKKLKFAIPISIFSGFVGAVVGCLLCRIM